MGRTFEKRQGDDLGGCCNDLWVRYWQWEWREGVQIAGGTDSPEQREWGLLGGGLREGRGQLHSVLAWELGEWQSPLWR